MSEREYLQNFVTISLLCINLFTFIGPIDTGASSTPKNLVNPQTLSSSDNINLNITGLNLFQNEYHRQSTSKSVATDRYKSTTPSNADSAYDHLGSNSRENRDSSSDYSYQDSKSLINIPDCKGRLKFGGPRGFITDGSGHYKTNLQCIWLIDSGRDNATIRLQLSQFNTECNYDYLYIFDGDSLYSPLVAALSGDIKDFNTALADRDILSDQSRISSPQQQQIRNISINSHNSTLPQNATDNNNNNNNALNNQAEFEPIELKLNSGKAFIYFHSDTAQIMRGFYMTYTIDSCPLDCSGKGQCDHETLTCKCNIEYYGNGCQYTICPNNCTSPEHGICDQQQSCICNDGYYGSDCSLTKSHQTWVNVPFNDSNILPKAFHQAVAINNDMWILGGRTKLFSNSNLGIFKKSKTIMVAMFNMLTLKWSDTVIEGYTGSHHLAEVSGHTAAVKDSKIYVYGGMALNNTILDSLTMLDIKTLTFTNLLTPDQKFKGVEEKLTAPVAVTGHSANIISDIMYIFMGFNHLYGYMNMVQKYNITDNTWSFVDRKGSSIQGCIGHTSTYDPVNELIYVYGGHNAHRINSLYSFDPESEVWTFLESGPSPRYYHSALIIDRQLIILGGNSYNSSFHNDKCFQQQHLIYDLSCKKIDYNQHQIGKHLNNEILAHIESPIQEGRSTNNNVAKQCYKRCWYTLDDSQPGIMKRHGHSLLKHEDQIVLYGGFNGLVLNDIRVFKVDKCGSSRDEQSCSRNQLGLQCYWDVFEHKCENRHDVSLNSTAIASDTSSSLSKSNANGNSSISNGCVGGIELRHLQDVCENRDTCTDCLSTNFGCVWCGNCQFGKCKSNYLSPITDHEACTSESSRDDNNSNRFDMTQHQPPKDSSQMDGNSDFERDIECKRQDNCYLCHSLPFCYWQNDVCSYSSSMSQPSQVLALGSPLSREDFLNEVYGISASTTPSSSSSSSSPSITRKPLKPKPPHRQFSVLDDRPLWSAASPLTTSESPQVSAPMLPQTVGPLISAYHSCDAPCYTRRSCNECISNKCIWCSSSDQCLDSSAYFVYFPIGQCMHYISHLNKCQVASCSDIKTCDKCLSNPKCGWSNDNSNTGKGTCMEGTSLGPLDTTRTFNSTSLQPELSPTILLSDSSSLSSSDSSSQNRWHYTHCPSCQCNGHSYCRGNTSTCIQPCQDNTDGNQCERCQSGYYGDPINGGSCKPCKCNGHAHSCNRETGKCYCSTKGIIGHHCNRCDEQNHYLGDPTSALNETCYYNLTTDYQYTFNMSKSEDHFYSDINFINIPSRRDYESDFTISCSRIAIVNVAAGSSYRMRRPLYTNLECGTFKQRLIPDKYAPYDGNYSFFINVQRFQTPFILQIAFSQHRTIYLPHVFFTFSSCFLFFFVLSGVIWKLKTEYDGYLRRQRQFIEMEQMASRPFSTICLELLPKQKLQQKQPLQQVVAATGEVNNGHRRTPSLAQPDTTTGLDQRFAAAEPTPISFEPCFSSNVGVVSLFVQLPGRPNLAIGSALVTLSSQEDDCSSNNNNNLDRNNSNYQDTTTTSRHIEETKVPQQQQQQSRGDNLTQNSSL